MITRKRLTKLIDPDFRRSVLNSIPLAKKAAFKIPQFARYTVDSCIVHRNVEHENDKDWSYGFTPIQCLAACMKDGSIQKRFFEFNSVNHFLKDRDGDAACEVVEAILIEWTKEDRGIADFDMDRIDAEFARIESEYKEERARKANDEEAGRKIKDIVEPVLDKTRGLPYEDAVGVVETEIRPLMEKAKADKTVFAYEFDLSRNTEDTRRSGEFFLDIGYKASAESETLVLVCRVRPEANPAGGNLDQA